MFNYTNTALAILEKANLITHEAAQKLSEELGKKIHQHKYDDAVAMVEEVMDKVKVFVAEPWVQHIDQLEKRVTELEKVLTAANAGAGKKVVAKDKA